MQEISKGINKDPAILLLLSRKLQLSVKIVEEPSSFILAQETNADAFFFCHQQSVFILIFIPLRTCIFNKEINSQYICSCVI